MEHNPIIAGGAAYLAIANNTKKTSGRYLLGKFFAMLGMKKCPSCNTLHMASSFYSDKNRPDGLSSRCKECDGKKIKAYQQKNRKRLAKHRSDYEKNRAAIDPVYKLRVTTPRNIRRSLQRIGETKRARTHQILGCSFPELHAHLERQFTKGMSWDKMWKEIEIDHIVPISSAKTEEEVLALSHYTNLRPCWKHDNRVKSDSMEFLI